MGDHSRTNTSSPIGQNPEHCSEQADQNHWPEALVRVRCAECRGRKENAGGSAFSQGHDLSLQVTSKDRFLANAGGNGERYPERYFSAPMREDELHIATLRVDAQEPAEYPKQCHRNQPEPGCNSNIPQHLAGGAPTIPENEENRCATMPHARHYKNENEPFNKNGDHITTHPVRTSRHPQLICKNLCQ